MQAQVEVRQLEHLDIYSGAIPPGLIPSGELLELLALDLHSSTPTLHQELAIPLGLSPPLPPLVDARLIKGIT